MQSRRRILTTVLLGSLSAGCLSSTSGAADRVNLTVHDPGSEVAGVTPDLGAPPEVILRDDNSQLVLVGLVYAGSSNCNRVVLEGVDWKSDTLTIQLGVGRQTDAPNSCTMDESGDIYEITVDVTKKRPETVVVKYSKNGEEWSVSVPEPQ